MLKLQLKCRLKIPNTPVPMDTGRTNVRDLKPNPKTPFQKFHSRVKSSIENDQYHRVISK